MASISSLRSRTMHRRDDAGRASEDDLFCPLVFSLVGLLASYVALLMPSETALDPLRFALIVGAPPVAALIALWLAGGPDEFRS
jgi:hypothetical protein